MCLFSRILFEGAEVDPAAEAAATAKKGGRSAYKLNSVGAQFRKQLQGLMGALNQCQPHYIRLVPYLIVFMLSVVLACKFHRYAAG